MINYSRLAIPVIAILAVGGVIAFFLAYNLYPEKHVNVTIDGSCYELLDDAHQQYVNLAAKNDIEKLRLQLSKVEQKERRVYLLSLLAETPISQISEIGTNYR